MEIGTNTSVADTSLTDKSTDASATSARPRITVVVVNWNGMPYLKRCLPLVVAEAGDESEVIVVDNASTDGSADYVAGHFPSVRLIRNSQNRGFAGGANDGWQAGIGDVCVLLNLDVSPLPGLFRELADALQKVPAAGVVGAKLLYPDGKTIQHAGGVLLRPLLDGKHRGRLEVDRGQYADLTDVEYVTGAAIALKRQLLEKLSGFDEGYSPLDYEDVDLCWRARNLGYRVLYVPTAMAIHHESATAPQASTQRWRTYHRGRVRTAVKHLPLREIHDQFLPAERDRLLSGAYCLLEEEAVRSAYLDILLSLHEIAAKRNDLGEGDVERLAEGLEGVRMIDRQRRPGTGWESAPAPEEAQSSPTKASTTLPSSTSGEASAPDAQSSSYPDLRSLTVLQPRPFVSSVPIFGPIIARFRQAWNDVATRWYLAPLIDQQSRLNQLLVDRLTEVQENSLGLWQSLSSIDQENTRLARELEASRTRWAYLQQELAHLQQDLKEVRASLGADGGSKAGRSRSSGVRL